MKNANNQVATGATVSPKVQAEVQGNQALQGKLDAAIALGEAIKSPENASLRIDARQAANLIIANTLSTSYLAKAITQVWVAQCKLTKGVVKASKDAMYRAVHCDTAILPVACKLAGAPVLTRLVNDYADGLTVAANNKAIADGSSDMALAALDRALENIADKRKSAIDAINAGLHLAFASSVTCLRQSGGWTLPVEVSALATALATGGSVRYKHFIG